MFALMDYVHGTIISHIKQAIVSYQKSEQLQDFIDYVQRKVCFFCLIVIGLFVLIYIKLADYIAWILSLKCNMPSFC